MFAAITGVGQTVLSLVVHGLCFGVPVLVLSGAAYYFLSLPARRHEHARLFIHLLETCLRAGKPVEPTLISIAAWRDRSPGLRFHLTAAHLEEGERLAAALAKSRLLPRALIAMLAAGERLGDVARVLPACRMHLQDARSGMRSAMNHFFVLVLGFAPIALWLFWLLINHIAPRCGEIFEGMTDEPAGGFWFTFMMASLNWAFWVEAVLLLALVLAALLYVCGPDTPGWVRKIAGRLADAFTLRIPWKRHRMQRNFAAILAVLLDADVPEPEAVELAAASSGNGVFQRRARRAVQQLAGGVPLAQAVAVFDSAGEFRWRLTNATHGRSGFAQALRGWFEALDARAFQQEQATAHLLTTGLVVLNGVVVGCVCAGIFGMLVQFIERAVLW
jgi:type II secretory pathway component PulF